MAKLIEARKICKTYRIGSAPIQVLKEIDFQAGKGEFVAIMGTSGSGKSTLLNILGCLDRPNAGTYLLDGREVGSVSDRELSRIRADCIGFIFQTFNLLPQLTVYENVEVPFLYGSQDLNNYQEKVVQAIKRVGLFERRDHKPAELSGGEMQRVAIARAVCKNPFLLLADEPTGNLDSRTGWEILTIFQQLHTEGATILMVTHDRDVAAFAGRRLILKDGIFIDI